MKFIATLATGAVLSVLPLTAPASGEGIDGALQAVLDGAAPDATISVLVYMSEQSDLRGLSDALDAPQFRLHDRHRAVVLDLQDTAARTQPDLVADLQAMLDAGTITDFETFWITNAIRVDAPRGVIEALADRPDVGHVFFDHPIEGIAPIQMGKPVEGGIAGPGPEPGVEAVRAPEVWEMGIDGSGVLVATLDTGVDGSHPALASRWRGLDPEYTGNPGWAFFDPVTNWTFPQDSGSHGTHTMGSVCGGAPGDSVGVAPGAQWIHAAVIDRVSIDQTISDSILAFQWVIDPDGDPDTSFDVPDVCSNSWGLTSGHVPNCDDTFWSFLDACEAAGVVIVFAAGNEGNSGLRKPADRATDDYRTFAVAAVDANDPNWPIAGFSSRGPTFCGPNGEETIKPDIAGPGVNVRSSFPGGGYNNNSGTSMSTPHINGVVALMRQVNPDLPVEQIKQIIYDTSFDLGTPGEDNDYGYGMADAFEAVQVVFGTLTFTYDFPAGLPDLVDPENGVTTIPIVVNVAKSNPLPGTGLLHVSYDGGDFVEVPLVENGELSYTAVFPDGPCGADVDYYFSIEADTGETVYSPFSAPEGTHSATAYTGEAIGFQDDAEEDAGWTVENSDELTDGAWDRGVPAGGGDRGDPEVDGDGSGQCWLTDNQDGNSDVDDGATTLTSPILDATVLGDPAISYYRWYSNNTGGSQQDVMQVQISNDGGSAWTDLETVGPDGPGSTGGWMYVTFLIADFVEPSDQLRVRFTVSDIGVPSIVEAGVDGLQISEFFCGSACPWDVTGDGAVDVDDLVEVILNWGPCAGCAADITGDGNVDVADLTAVIVNWAGCP